MTANRQRRVSHPPLRFDWSPSKWEPGSALYVARPDQTFSLYAYRASGGVWRWSISMASDKGMAPIHTCEYGLPTLIRAKLAAESWYTEHGGRPSQTEVWTEVKPDSDPPPF